MQEWAARIVKCFTDLGPASVEQMSADARCSLLYSLYFDIGSQLPDSCLHLLMQPLAARLEECR